MHLLLMDGEELRGALIEWPQMAWGIKVAGAVVRKLTQAKLQSNEWVWVRLQNINHFFAKLRMMPVVLSVGFEFTHFIWARLASLKCSFCLVFFCLCISITFSLAKYNWFVLKWNTRSVLRETWWLQSGKIEREMADWFGCCKTILTGSQAELLIHLRRRVGFNSLIQF